MSQWGIALVSYMHFYSIQAASKKNSKNLLTYRE